MLPRFTLPSARRATRRVLTGTALALAAVLGLALPASAHITVGADDPHQGAADAVLTFRVPNEQAGATTVKVEISFPKATPLASVRPAPKPGWTVSTTKVAFTPPITTDDGTISEGVGTVVYTATTPAAGIPDGGFDAFQVLVGPLPEKATTLAFPTVQTYSNGHSVAWVAPVTDPANEPENPAPTLRLLAADGAGAPASAGASATTGAGSGGKGSGAPAGTGGATVAAAAPAATPAGATADDVSGARRLAVISLVVAVVAVLAGGAATVLARRRPASVE